MKQIEELPRDEEKLVELKTIIQENDVNLSKMGKEVQNIYEFLLIMEDFCFNFSQDEIENFWALKQQPLEIKGALVKGKDNAMKQEEKLKNQLEREKNEFEKELLNLAQCFEQEKQYKDYSNYKEIWTLTMSLHEKIEKSLDTVKSFNRRENLFNLQYSEY